MVKAIPLGIAVRLAGCADAAGDHAFGGIGIIFPLFFDIRTHLKIY
jgi:hypothetical protein